jgi:hypothetical protein
MQWLISWPSLAIRTTIPHPYGWMSLLLLELVCSPAILLCSKLSWEYNFQFKKENLVGVIKGDYKQRDRFQTISPVLLILST